MEKAIYNILTNTTAVTDLVSTRIYPDAIPQDVTIPAITFTRLGTAADHTKDGVSILDTVSIAVSNHDDDLLNALALADVVRTALDRNSGSFGGTTVQSIRFDDQDTDFNDNQPKRYVVTQKYSMRINL